MASEIFLNMLPISFHHVEQESIKLPIIFFVVGHRTLLTYEVSKDGSQLKIELIALYTNSTKIQKSADVLALLQIKLSWKKAIREW